MCCLCIVDMGKRSRAAAIALLVYDHRSYSISPCNKSLAHCVPVISLELEVCHAPVCWFPILPPSDRSHLAGKEDSTGIPSLYICEC